MVEYSYVLMIGIFVFLVLVVLFVFVKVLRSKRIIIGFFYVILYFVSVMVLMLLFEIGIEICIRYNYLGISGIEFRIIFILILY